MRNLIRKFIVWYIWKFEDGNFTIKRKGGADQMVRIMSLQAWKNVFEPAKYGSKEGVK